MQITLAAVGHARPGPERLLFDQYRRRLGWSFALKEVEEKRPLSVPERIARETALLLGAVPQGSLMVSLDERGAVYSSEAFAARLAAWRDHGRAKIAFLIGGADGHSDELRNQSDLLLSFGAMTWPHMLVRALLAEQLYRAECILANHPYHRG
ncbi:23S rRNA (pseudouridine(1915)-N(3))-methyltransferase RlmH [Telmatospirillum sp.]|uniref:23S rRNA (pseudouridine(1915)-N(3))-methyltransferase RlmH n=1 Tax=Telmatospirillum sp. TaxID=2079197 RepID=UPI0028449287|nr:23S rRNA (pseudouridine(1915)-N(3))-methyltransferase RlmH [Telmatospirillum sp.]MDR3436551.1 23S rRNA (pseudouridine(1915)-N(3))-methyltransferase RlmH [Telmatospirillum sp.]